MTCIWMLKNTKALCIPIKNDSRIKHTMPSMNHVIIHGYYHHCWIENNSAIYTGIHCWVWLLFHWTPLLMQAFKQLIDTIIKMKREFEWMVINRRRRMNNTDMPLNKNKDHSAIAFEWRLSYVLFLQLQSFLYQHNKAKFLLVSARLTIILWKIYFIAIKLTFSICWHPDMHMAKLLIVSWWTQQQ